ncbi:glycoside hydrolase family 3 C-terminal domain-containing protein [Novosphingobium resinovorum]|uniref:Beta-D-glucoside glucohydrolase n=1 Tax=Novosphingobium resinovorum TaxID=158500 RepID=A0A031JS97_9SPHN|nr:MULTISPECIES: glycoside hydrolase family 3 C-terminal domain-containing protein [Novosphingobium]AOR79230.1 glycosyl hydrolase [Novosphingobium resinovorum]EZP79759.1 Beta-glucosidase [Novosphingobium resinovorum]MBF7014866.1 glycoside hydrolase family 3 C-terminal domain-containing protein [Novosphingobium sp. HR1a]WJM24656.1 glycoside hydrolase family 3 C-terminal domain-containing protein [Novosphingobium resinovorum]
MTTMTVTKTVMDTIAAMTPADKAALLTGHGMWRTRALSERGVPALLMTDGAYGVRYSTEQIDDAQEGGQDLEQFLAVVNTRARDMEAAFGTTRPATCFPNGSAIACSWDVDMARALGATLAAECRAFDVNILLGPGINTRRTPLGGRSYEYYSEDPVVSGDFATGVVSGLQDNGVGASLKHFACNNSEVERTTMDSVVDPRALREIYLLGFERVVRRAQPWTVMSSYNRLNGVQTSADLWLLTDLLRDEWGFEGVVVSDWHGIKDRPASLLAGNDLDMPENASRHRALLAAIEDGSLPAEAIDRACARVLRLVEMATEKAGPVTPFDPDAHHEVARAMAAESIVLLRNEDAMLPLQCEGLSRIAVIGEGAKRPVIQGSGSATTAPTRVDIPFDEIVRIAGEGVQVDFLRGYDHDGAELEALRAEAVAGVAGVDVAVVFVTTDSTEDGEGADRKDLALAAGHDALIQALADTGVPVVVVLTNPDAVVMPWLGNVHAVVETFFAGQGMGGALAEILFGLRNPCGKLTVTFPQRMEDIPGFLTYPGEGGVHRYVEGIFVGYRHYDRRKVEPLFPFGFGLSYTQFAYSDLVVETPVLDAEEDLHVRLSVTNTGAVAGKEIVQLYLGFPDSKVHRADRELRAFAKVALAPGETREVRLRVAARDLCFFDPELNKWRLEAGRIRVEAGASSRDIRVTGEAEVVLPHVYHRPLRIDSEPKHVLANPVARRHFEAFLAEKLDLTPDAAKAMLAYTSTSFFGIRTTLNYFFRQDLDRAEIAEIVARINAEPDMAAPAAEPVS